MTEPWVDTKAVAKHLNRGYAMVRTMADNGEIPCFIRKSGKMTYRFFKISLVDAAMSNSAYHSMDTEGAA